MKYFYTLLLCLLSLQGNLAFAQIADKESLSLIGGTTGEGVGSGIRKILVDSAPHLSKTRIS